MRNSRDDRNVDDVSSALRNLRLQDSELQVMSDEGFALSMHQPWASLLVAGIKRFVMCSHLCLYDISVAWHMMLNTVPVQT